MDGRIFKLFGNEQKRFLLKGRAAFRIALVDTKRRKPLIRVKPLLGRINIFDLEGMENG